MTTRVRVLHVVATGTRRGAEFFASDLSAALPEWVDQRFSVVHPPVADELFRGRTVQPLEAGSAFPGVGVDLRSARRLRTTIVGWRPHVVHAHGGEAFKYIVAASVGLSVPILYRKIGLAPPWIRSGLRLQAHRRLLRRADLIVAVADSVKHELVSLFRVDEDDVVVVPRGIDPARTQAVRSRDQVRDELGIDRSAFVVLSLGALHWEKDPLAHLRVTLPEIRSGGLIHVFAGDGPLRRELELEIAREGIGAGVRVLGNRADVGDLLAASDTMLLVSRSEGMPGCLIEAGMAGLPCVAHDVGGVSEVVIDGSTGSVRPKNDIEGMREALLTLRSDPDLRATMGSEARDRYRRFDIEIIASAYEEIYLRIGRGERPRVA